MDKKKLVPSNKATPRDKSRQRAAPSDRKAVLTKASNTLLMVKPMSRIKKERPDNSVLQTRSPVQAVTSGTRMPRAEPVPDVRREEKLADRSSVATGTRTPVDVASTTTRQGPSLPVVPLVQSFVLVWADTSIDESSENHREIITKLREIVNSVKTFTDVDDCIDFVKSIKDEKIFLITSNAAGQSIIPEVHGMSELDSCYLFVVKTNRNIQWAKSWSKIKDVYNNIESICEVLKQSLLDCEHNDISISFLPIADDASSRDLNELDPSFMYTTVLKEILLQVDFNEETMLDFFDFCRKAYAGNEKELANVEKVEREYNHYTPIWWYTLESFMYSMINRALRLIDFDIILRLGFFIRDLHCQIEKLHAEQFLTHNQAENFIVYRGQGLSQPHLETIYKSKGGLISFNSFLSTSRSRNVAYEFTERSLSKPLMFGVLFVMRIDPSISATPFAHTQDFSAFGAQEDEVLFAMNAVFRIANIRQIKDNNRLFEIELVLTSDSDPQLRTLTNRLREETEESTGWFRLGRLLLKLNEFEKAEKIYEMLLKNTNDESKKATIYNQIGLCKDSNGKYAEAADDYENARQYLEKLLPPDDPTLATLYNNLGAVYECTGEHSIALSYHFKALEIREDKLPQNHPDLAQSYNNIGSVHYQREEHADALRYYEKALTIFEATLPANHPDLATAYNNIGSAYDSLKGYEIARSYYEKALVIDKKALTANHPNLAISYNNLGSVHDNMGEFDQAVVYHERALAIYETALPADHPDLASSYNNIGRLYDRMGERSKAESYSERAVNIAQRALPTDHPHLLQSRRNLEAAQKRH